MLMRVRTKGGDRDWQRDSLGVKKCKYHAFLKCFGSMNVNGVNEESRLGIETLLKDRNFDVSQGDYYWISL